MDGSDRLLAQRRPLRPAGSDRAMPPLAACFAPAPRPSLLDEFDRLLDELLVAEPAPSPQALPARSRRSRTRPAGKARKNLLRIAVALGVGSAVAGSLVAFAWLGRDHGPVAPHPSAPESKAAAVDVIVQRIILAESNGDPTARNKRSTATGAAQFLDETWLRMVRVHRPDLARQSEKDVLELRRDPDLSREITARFAERNAALLARRGLAVTPGRLYLSHFAGGGGAVAILLAPDEADAAAVMAAADVTGRTTREKIVKANPFLDTFTVAALKRWADRKMCGRPSSAHAPAAGPPSGCE